MTLDLTPRQARHVRWRTQLMGGSMLDPTAVVGRAVALQGQDLPAVLRAIAIRSRDGTTVADVRGCFDRGELVRSWPMRGTLFATTPANLAALLRATGERTRRSTQTRRRALGLDDDTLARSRAVIVEALGDRPRTRGEALELWQDAGIDTAGGRGYHLIFHHSVAGLMHWGPFDASGREQLLTLSGSATAAPAAGDGAGGGDATGDQPDADVELASIVRGYVAARGPVSESDLAWWTKLPKTLLRRAAALIDDLVDVSVAGAPAWMIGDADAIAGQLAEIDGERPLAPALIPAFDEWVLGYGDRSIIGSPVGLQAMVPGGNGVFRRAVLVDGVIVGTWSVKPREVDLVEPVSATVQRRIDTALRRWPHD